MRQPRTAPVPALLALALAALSAGAAPKALAADETAARVERPALPSPLDSPVTGGADMLAAFSAYQKGYYLSAFRIAEPLAHMGDAAAQSLVAELSLRGQGVPLDVENAARWYRLSAQAGRPEAQFRYALMLLQGEGVARDPAQARTLMHSAADAGLPLAAFNYGQMLIQGAPTGGFADALRYFEVAADAGLSDAQYALAQLYANGRGVTARDDITARFWLREAARQGHDTAQIELGIWLINGRGGPAAPHDGFRWLKAAADRGNPIAVNRVAHLYKDGIGVAADRAEAAKWTVLARRARNADPALDNFFRSLPAQEQKAALEAANRFGAS
ncbi:tetratricopeptide repeat protein [Aureimonas frigidaquae]|uniref:tetratricopeptide repeat protein n=1 Tax=Aureimonas frigidaquae TaxID=424757 RepID=UPI0007845514|nr:tetratricopeptide repeat protein [Aureimonas frigidaquae]